MVVHVTLLPFRGDGLEVGQYQYIVMLETGESYLAAYDTNAPRDVTKVTSAILDRVVLEVQEQYRRTITRQEVLLAAAKPEPDAVPVPLTVEK